MWLDVLAMIGMPAAFDPHLSPDYMAAELLLGGEPRLTTYKFEHYYVVKPVVMRPVVIGKRKFGMDVTSPQGYGGPVTNHGARLHEWFDAEFREWCKRMGVICEYCALNPMHLPHQRVLMKPIGVDLRERKQVVWMNLADRRWAEPESVYRGVDYKDTRIAGIKAAHKHRVTIRQVETTDEAVVFIGMYLESMERKDASPRWRFPAEYLRALCNAYTVFVATVGTGAGDVASSALIMTGGETAYYHMAANNPAHSKAGANDLLIHEVALWARTSGIKRLHLGGGVTSAPDDPVLFFKGGFSPLRAPAMSYFRVLDEGKYRAACAAKVEQEIDETGAEFTTSFEPMYRREAA